MTEQPGDVTTPETGEPSHTAATVDNSELERMRRSIVRDPNGILDDFIINGNHDTSGITTISNDLYVFRSREWLKYYYNYNVTHFNPSKPGCNLLMMAFTSNSAAAIPQARLIEREDGTYDMEELNADGVIKYLNTHPQDWLRVNVTNDNLRRAQQIADTTVAFITRTSGNEHASGHITMFSPIGGQRTDASNEMIHEDMFYSRDWKMKVPYIFGYSGNSGSDFDGAIDFGLAGFPKTFIVLIQY